MFRTVHISICITEMVYGFHEQFILEFLRQVKNLRLWVNNSTEATQPKNTHFYFTYSIDTMKWADPMIA